jgi:molecular chaperone DnaK
MKFIGIDLGTTNSVVSVYEMGNSHTIKLKGTETTPSIIIGVNPDGYYIAGREAKQLVAFDPNHILISTKRDLGSSKTYQIAGETLTPREAATFILCMIKREAARTLHEEVNDVVITVPAHFGFQEIGEVKKAAIDVGLNPLAIIPEPTAAAIRYGIDAKSRQSICVIDLGGGTFDVSVLDVNFDKRTQKHIITPINWDGDHYLGGDDFDNIIIDWMIQNGAKGYTNKLELKAIAEAAKIELASFTDTFVSHPLYMPQGAVLTRDIFKELIQDKLDQIGDTIKRTVNESVIDGEHINMADINCFILIGGSCKHPVVREFIKGIIGKEPFNAPNLDTYVAEGAAMFHHTLKNPNGNLTVGRKLSKTLGTDVFDGQKGYLINAILLRKGEDLPTRAVSIFHVREGQEHVRISVLEGSAEKADDPANKALQPLEVDLSYRSTAHPLVTEYCVDASGLLTFNCYEVPVTQENVDDLNELVKSMKGEACVIAPSDWDTFLSKHSSECIKKNIQLNVFE